MKLIQIVVGLAISFCCLSTELESDFKSTLAYELLELEFNVGEPEANSKTTLLNAITVGVAAAKKTGITKPKSKVEALKVLKAVHDSLAKLNFLQPMREENWPDTLGVAFIPLMLSEKELAALLVSNQERGGLVDPLAPIYYVDCDMGSLLFIAVAESLGWDFRLVEVPNHNFIRWHIDDNLIVNWDWTYSGSKDDVFYRNRVPDTLDPRVQSLYLRSLSHEEARAYYTGLVASQGGQWEKIEPLFEVAIASLPNHPLTLNNYAWFVATNAGVAKEKIELALSRALTALSLRPNSVNYMDTVACANSANGNTELALALEDYAITKATSVSQRKSFLNNRKLISEKNLCE